jgi:hypothetical protein
MDLELGPEGCLYLIGMDGRGQQRGSQTQRIE